MQNSLVPQRRIQVRYVTVTKVRGYSCAAEVPVVSVSAVVEDFPHGSICHIPTATWQKGGPITLAGDIQPAGQTVFSQVDARVRFPAAPPEEQVRT